MPMKTTIPELESELKRLGLNSLNIVFHYGTWYCSAPQIMLSGVGDTLNAAIWDTIEQVKRALRDSGG